MDLATLSILIAFAATALLERLVPGRSFPRQGIAWPVRGLAFFVVTLLVSSRVPPLWDEWMSVHRLLDIRVLGTWGGGAVGFVVFEALLYVWHLALHRVPLLWRFHQMHHSAERVDIWGANFFHPLDAVGFSLLTSVSMVWILGATPGAAMVVGLGAVFANFFQHANVPTPRWLGLFIQRPESHAVHHERGVHAYNYSDLPIFDWLFGTFRNPACWEGEAGFWDGASSRLGEMLLGRDVTRPPEEEPDAIGRVPAGYGASALSQRRASS